MKYIHVLKVGYFGEPGAYSNIAAMQMIQGDYVPLESVRAVFDALSNKEIHAGVVPIENSIEGSVNQTYDFLFKSDFSIVKEHYLRIEHCLIARQGVKLGDIKYVLSHPQALSQCSEFIYNHGIKPVGEYDTAGSVKIVKNYNKNTYAAIASELAARINNMEIIVKNIENTHNNYTRFFLISENPILPAGHSKISLAFSIVNRIGGLYNILKVFNDDNINMTKIESRPIQYNPFNYLFFIDIEKNDRSDHAISLIRKMTTQFRVLGTYESATVPQ